MRPRVLWIKLVQKVLGEADEALASKATLQALLLLWQTDRAALPGPWAKPLEPFGKASGQSVR